MPTVEPLSQGEIITQRLAELELSVSHFARELGVEPSFIHAIKTGKRRLTRGETIQRAAEVLGISIDPLYLAINRVPPDVLAMMQEHPILLDAVRKLNAKLDKETQPAPAFHA